jgi:DNA-binding MarR family transcriptional regulator
VKKKRDAVCLCESARRLARNLTSLYEAELADSGLNISQFTVMRYLEALEPVHVSNLAEAVELDQSTMTRNLLVLKKLGVVDIAIGREDARTKVVRLSSKGARILKKARSSWERAQIDAKSKLKPQLSRLLFELG